ncbi:hypothetical protein EV356DRAFT_507847 [Viridothelium virens]|uniref:Uncharacterized protein n=1 Tax=Viridothelium virens TaxID=1048519 RepID=A0A6A6H0G3_VIRVR|nr:hypothetical protein EV356DRAFT_507847 [Viridothelium virens]
MAARHPLARAHEIQGAYGSQANPICIDIYSDTMNFVSNLDGNQNTPPGKYDISLQNSVPRPQLEASEPIREALQSLTEQRMNRRQSPQTVTYHSDSLDLEQRHDTLQIKRPQPQRDEEATEIDLEARRKLRSPAPSVTSSLAGSLQLNQQRHLQLKRTKQSTALDRLRSGRWNLSRRRLRNALRSIASGSDILASYSFLTNLVKFSSRELSFTHAVKLIEEAYSERMKKRDVRRQPSSRTRSLRVQPRDVKRAIMIFESASATRLSSGRGHDNRCGFGNLSI